MWSRARRLGAFAKDRPGVAIAVAAAAGVTLAALIVRSLAEACFAATAHWQAAGSWSPGSARAFFGLFQVSAQLCAAATHRPPWILISGMVAAPSVLLTWYWRDRKRRDDHRLAVESGIAERYTRAAELLASTDSMTRINGLFSLWDVARESQTHRVTVARTLAAFVRVRSTVGLDNTRADAPPLADVQTAVTLVADTDWSDADWITDNGRVQIDLRGARLVAFDLARKDLVGAFLRGTDFSHAYMHRVAMRGALLMEAKLTHAFLRSASLRGANLRDADLSGADLIKADLRDTILDRTNLRGARYCARTTRLPPGFDPEAHAMSRDDQPAHVPAVFA